MGGAWAKAAMIFFVGAVVASAQADGKLKWPAPYKGGDSGSFPRIDSSPTVGPDGTVYVGVHFDTVPMTGMLLAINPDGSPKKKPNGTPWGNSADGGFATPDAIDGSPALSPDGTAVYVPCEDGRLYALNTVDGTQKWPAFDTGRNSAIYCSPAVAADGTIYVGSTNVVTSSDSVFYAVSPDTGQKLWAAAADATFNGAETLIASSPAIAPDGTIYFCAGNTLTAVTPAGDVKWTFAMKGAIYANPAIGGDGAIYIGSDGNDFYALTPEGKQKWSTAIAVGGGAAIGANGIVYVGALDHKMYALNPGDGSMVKTATWPVTTGDKIFTIPAVRGDGTIIFGSDDNNLWALNPDGTKAWTLNVGDDIDSSPAIADDGTIYFGARNGNLYALTGSGSPLSRYSAWPMFNHDVAHTSRAPTQIAGGRLVNLATRGLAGPGINLIAGVVLEGNVSKQLLVRAVGPTLASFSVPNPLADPFLSFRISSATQPFVNDNWQQSYGAESDSATYEAAIRAVTLRAGTFALPDGSKDAAIAEFSAPTSWTASVTSTDGSSGVALVEIYDGDPSNTGLRLINLSTRGRVGNGAGVLIPGFVVAGPGKLRVLVRAVGPGLKPFGVTGVLDQPAITLYQGTTPLKTNTGWTANGLKGDIAGASQLAGAFALDPANSDSAMILSLAPGAYTAQVAGANNGTGEALVEVYALPF